MVDVTNLDEAHIARSRGEVSASDALHVVERYTLESMPAYKATLEEIPRLSRGPGKSACRSAAVNVKLLEYECVYYLQDKKYRAIAKPVAVQQ